MSKLDLTGYYCYYTADEFETALTGEILGELSDGVYVIQRDIRDLENKEPNLIREILSLKSMLEADGFYLFESKKVFDQWWSWTKTPSNPQVIRFVKK